MFDVRMHWAVPLTLGPPFLKFQCRTPNSLILSLVPIAITPAQDQLCCEWENEIYPKLKASPYESETIGISRSCPMYCILMVFISNFRGTSQERPCSRRRDAPIIWRNFSTRNNSCSLSGLRARAQGGTVSSQNAFHDFDLTQPHTGVVYFVWPKEPRRMPLLDRRAHS